MKKGYLYTIEVLIAASLIFVAMAFLFKTPPMKPETELSMIKRQGFEALEYMDNSEIGLRPLVYNKNESAIESQLSGLLRSEYVVEICSEGSTCVDSHAPINQTVIVVDYYISGYRDSYSAKKLRLFLWRKY
ncbi:MAG: hypothetical protein HZB67_02580 [Candidatus Aenigmarchaeota archaeon]|nr:hypothetical protein [Candidatus Aenigmarchaeota archaeon]